MEENTVNTSENTVLSIGQQLVAARQNKNYSFEKIAKDIKVKKLFIEALENNEFKALPSLITARGFIKIYGNYLGLNVEPLLKQFDELYPGLIMGATAHPSQIELGMEVDKKELLPSGGLKTMNQYSMSFNRNVRNRSTRKLLSPATTKVALGIAFLIIISVYLSMSLNAIKTMPRQAADVATPNAQETPESLKNMTIDKNKVYINIEAMNKTYVTAIIDGRMVFRGMLEKGDAKAWEGTQYIRLKASVPHNISLFLNGTSAGYMDDSLMPIEKTYFPGTNIATANTKVIDDTPKEAKKEYINRFKPVVVDVTANTAAPATEKKEDITKPQEATGPADVPGGMQGDDKKESSKDIYGGF